MKARHGRRRARVGAVLLTSLVVVPAGSAMGQDGATASPERQRTAVKQVRAIRVNPHAPAIDGHLDDAIWQKAAFADGFVQKDPNEGEAARNRTEIAVAYDDEAVYIAARMTSTDPENILATLSRRDNPGTAERILVSLDSYRDRRTAYTFGVTASGVRVDYYHGADYEYHRDYDFNPVWRAATARTAVGWNAEMRIPLSQLRFNNSEDQVWGMNVNRWVPTENEDSYWVLVPKQETGWSSRMGEIVGITGLRPSRRIELMPYLASDATLSSAVEPDNPFEDGTAYDMRLGGEFKMGVSSNLTLEGTVNPDFGQVEADPAEVNLSAYETFFAEKRPFFTEGSNLFSGGGAGYFYSRRIGAPPHGAPQGDFVDTPTSTSILGAAKLTGRLNSGLSVGMLGAVTGREKAKVFDNSTGQTAEEDVEPLSGYGVVRLQQEFGKNQSTAGVIVTAVERDVNDTSSLGAILAQRAFAGGSDWNLRFASGKYEMGGNLGFSYVEGSTDVIADIQQRSAHYYQRPDADHVEFDPTRTSLSGWTGKLWLEKAGGEHWLWAGVVGAESPGFEINDAGQLSAADDIDTWASLRYRETKPGAHFQNWWVQGRVGSGWNFGADRQYAFLDMESAWTFKNYMGTFLGYEYYPSSLSDNLTRGGPLMRTGSEWNVWLEGWSGPQNRTTWGAWTGYLEDELGGWGYWIGGSVTLRPGDRWQLSFNPSWNQRRYTRQYVDTIDNGGDDTYGARYVFSTIERGVLVAQTRLNYSFTPDLTLELYAEPFAASGRYHHFGELEAARSKNLREYGKAAGTSIEEPEDGIYQVTDGADTFTIEQPDFNYLSFRSNLVLRWEWSPGSTLFLVWQMNRATQGASGSLVGPRDLWDSITADGDNFLAIKVTYWIPFR